jgi:hypothetical protein
MSQELKPQPKFKFGDIVESTDGSTGFFTIQKIELGDTGYFYSPSGKLSFWIAEKYLQLYTPPARTYTFTKQQLAEAWDYVQECNEVTFANFCIHLEMSDE